jgi:hypothetical protein
MATSLMEDTLERSIIRFYSYVAWELVKFTEEKVFSKIKAYIVFFFQYIIRRCPVNTKEKWCKH